MNDPIERQDAIDAHCEICGDRGRCNSDICSDMEVFQLLPSAQPEQAAKGCRNCKYGKYNDHWKTHFCYNPNDCTEWNLWEPSVQPDNRLSKIAELVGGTIDHFDLDDAMDLLYQIKEIVGNEQ